MAWIFSQDKTIATNIGFLSFNEFHEGTYVLVGGLGSLTPQLILGYFSSMDRVRAVIKDFIGHLDTRGMVGSPGAYHVPSDDAAMLLV